MNILQNYSLQLGQKIGKCHVYEKLYPLLCDRFIVIQPWSKQSKNYDLWGEVISIILPIISKAGYKLVQVGSANEPPLNGCIHTQGSTSWGQLEYLISNASMVISTDSISSHLAGHYNKPLVCLISNNFKECVSPYFGDKDKQVFLEPKRIGNPSFSNHEQIKLINTIPPESIASAVCKLLDLEFNYPYTSVYNGDIFIVPMLETAMFDPINIEGLGISNIICRMDFNFNEDVLAKQLIICPCSIVTNKPIRKELLDKFKPRLKEVVYFIEENNHAFDFYDNVIKLGVPLRLISGLSKETINTFKIDYMEIGAIQEKPKVNIDEVLSKNNCQFSDLYYNSSKFTIGKGGVIYPSRAAMLANLPVSGIGNMDPIKVIDNQEFKDELLHFRLFKV